MLSIKLIAVSLLKPGPFKELQDHYLKILKPYARVEIVEVPPEKFSSTAQRERALDNEAEKIRRQIPGGAFVIALEASGKTFSSKAFAKELAKWSVGGGKLCVILGGPLGLSDEIKKEADGLLSLSPLTFPHDLARVVFLEQLYRASTILAGKTYHY